MSLDDSDRFCDTRGAFQCLVCLLLCNLETLAVNLDDLGNDLPCSKLSLGPLGCGCKLWLTEIGFEVLLAISLPLHPFGFVVFTDLIGAFLHGTLALGRRQEVFEVQCFLNG